MAIYFLKENKKNMLALTVGIFTLGCKVNQYESRAIEEEFMRRGFSVLPSSQPCDIYVINTCSVTAEADRKARQFIRRAVKKNPHAGIIVCGCYSQRDPDSILSIPGVDRVIGNENKLSCVDMHSRVGVHTLKRITVSAVAKFSSLLSSILLSLGLMMRV